MARTRVFQHDSNPAADSPDFHVSKSSRRSLLKHGRAVELPDGSLQMKPPLNAATCRKKVFSNGTGGGWWRSKYSGGAKVLQFDKTDWPIPTPASNANPSNGFPLRMHLFKERKESAQKLNSER